MELAAQQICSLIRMNAKTLQIDFYPSCAVDSWLIYKLEKLTDQRFQVKISLSSLSGNSELNPPPSHAFGIPNYITP